MEATTRPSPYTSRTFLMSHERHPCSYLCHYMGLVYAGLALGPTLGGLIVKHTKKSPRPLLFALAMHLIYLVGVFAFIPESTSKEFRAKALREYNESRAEIKRRANERKTAELQPLLRSNGSIAENSPFQKRAWKRVKPFSWAAYSTHLWSRSASCFPKKLPWTIRKSKCPQATLMVQAHLAAPLSRLQKHLPLTLSVSRVAPRPATTTTFRSSRLRTLPRDGHLRHHVIQDAVCAGAVRLGRRRARHVPHLPHNHRVLALTAILPIVIKFLHRPVKAYACHRTAHRRGRTDRGSRLASPLDPGRRRKTASQDELVRRHRSITSVASADPSDEEDGEQGEWDDTKKSVEELWTLRAKHLRLIHDSKFDLKLAKISMMVNAISYGRLIFSNTPQLFFLATAVTSLGGGGGAAMSSLALALLKSPADAGKAVWRVEHHLAPSRAPSSVPSSSPNIFKRTTKTFPPAIFVVGSGFVLHCIPAAVRGQGEEADQSTCVAG